MSSQSSGSSLAILGLFLALALIVPGLVYLAFLYLFYPGVRPILAAFNSAADLLAIAIVLGVVITSACFALEIIIVDPLLERVARLPKITTLAKLEARDKPALYLTQLYGQYFMHLNIGLGLLLILMAYPIVLYADPALVQPSGHFVSPYGLLGGLGISVTNLFIALVPLRRFSIEVESQYVNELLKKS